MTVLDHHRMIESWTWYAFASLVFVSRLISRTMLLGGIRRFKFMDFAMIITFAVYTNFVVWVNIQGTYNKTNVVLPPETVAAMSQEEIDFRTYGSIVTFIVEQSMILVQWGCKACIISLLWNLTYKLRERFFVRMLIAYVGTGLFLIELFFLAIWCRPMTYYWVVADDNDPQCKTSENHLIMSFAFNVSSDIIMILIPMRIIIRSQLPWKRKAVLGAIFGLGIFVIIAATLNRYYCFVHPDDISWIFWYVREASTTIIVTNLPCCYNLMRYVLLLKVWSKIRDRLGCRHSFRCSHRYSFRRDVLYYCYALIYRRWPLAAFGGYPPVSDWSCGMEEPEGVLEYIPESNVIQFGPNFSTNVNTETAIPLQIWQRSGYSINGRYLDHPEAPIFEDSDDEKAVRRPPPVFFPTTTTTITSGPCEEEYSDQIV